MVHKLWMLVQKSKLAILSKLPIDGVNFKLDFWIQWCSNFVWHVTRIQKSFPIWRRQKVEVYSTPMEASKRWGLLYPQYTVFDFEIEINVTKPSSHTMTKKSLSAHPQFLLLKWDWRNSTLLAVWGNKSFWLVNRNVHKLRAR